jgi:hypothetical protein
MNFTVHPATRDDFGAFAALQEQVLVSRLAPEERANGFVTTGFNPDELEEILSLDESGLWIAETENGDLAGWVFGLSWNYCARRPLFQLMLQRFPLSLDDAFVDESNSFQWGPVAIAPQFRGTGVLEALFAGVKRDLAPRFPFGATCISTHNPRSLAAHTRKLQMRVVDEWPFHDVPWQTLAFPT